MKNNDILLGSNSGRAVLRIPTSTGIGIDSFDDQYASPSSIHEPHVGTVNFSSLPPSVYTLNIVENGQIRKINSD